MNISAATFGHSVTELVKLEQLILVLNLFESLSALSVISKQD